MKGSKYWKKSDSSGVSEMFGALSGKGFRGIDKNLIHTYAPFSWIREWQWSSNFLQKLHVQEKSGSWIMAPSASQPIRLLDS